MTGWKSLVLLHQEHGAEEARGVQGRLNDTLFEQCSQFPRNRGGGGLAQVKRGCAGGLERSVCKFQAKGLY